jgi:YesN/AraC family two-component response regulator
MIQAFLAKPFTTHELLQSLHQIINKSSTNHQQTI